MSRPSETLRRHAALEKTLEKYRAKPFNWRESDCIRMARSHLRNMGHRPPRVPAYRSAVGAKRALKETGFDTIEALLASLLPQIAPAAMLPGDLAVMQGDEHFDAVAICVGRKIFGFFEGEDAPVIIVPREIKAAFRV